ncbi:polysaccharide deacetylase [Agrobacterium sp. TS43]|uniref:polysaccharide deacetylase family protein n=1 Tax=Agrobacterium TaxID=357 RepID=UPI000364FC75|nr:MULTISPECIES: polysaccharide deacetylase family protein [Agrobacterium]EPR23084.1 polysaccharide deacetylase [Agrobacterium radiobacter DSM 30147]KDR86876.1 polysaccharide deacetylase [Agrobacterium tumefaciens GW4]KVK42449.1 polysaccharide deacetylase [Agrobacterium sp. LY4]KVK42781.1 polysaccharide deacetylase [Agrobacterium sp. JL28]KVK57026.1 polysaccharide deacetylase [Agrobacterium sp. TS45]
MSLEKLVAALDECGRRGISADLWLRDDDAVEPTPALDTLLDLCGGFSAPVTLAVIPEMTTDKLAQHLDVSDIAQVAVHGWSHTNYAGKNEKKQELGSHRDPAVILDELQSGLDKLHDLHGGRLVPMLVPPWNRIDADIVKALAGLGYRTLSVFGPEKSTLPPCLNTHVDVIDWHGSRGGRNDDVLFAETAARILTTAENGGTTGILTHHLVHDDNVWRFLRRLFEVTADHPAARWRSSKDLVDEISP